MIKFFGPAQDQQGNILTGFTARVLKGDGSAHPIYADSGGTNFPVVNIAPVDVNGMVEFYYEPENDLNYQLLNTAGSIVNEIRDFASEQANASNKAQADAVGVSPTATNLGTFTSPLIDDNVTAKAALESIADNLAARSNFRSLLDMGSGAIADGTTSNVAAFNALLALGGGFVPKQALPYAIDSMITMPDDSILSVEAGAVLKWTGTAGNGSTFQLMFEAGNNCQLVCENGEFFVTSAAADRFLWPVIIKGKANVIIKNLRGLECQHVYAAASGAGDYASVVTSGGSANVNTNLKIIGGGSTYTTALAGTQSTAACYIGYTIGWVVDSASYYNGVSGVQWWGGDANPSTGNGALVNERKCRDGLVKDVIVDEMIGGGVWGSMGDNITVPNSSPTNCHDVGCDAEGSFNVTWIACSPRHCDNGAFTEFFFCKNIVYQDCSPKDNGAGKLLTYQNDGGNLGLSDGSHIIGGFWDGLAGAPSSIDDANGRIRNLTIGGGAIFRNAKIDFSAGAASQNLNFNEFTMLYDTAASASFFALRAGNATSESPRDSAVDLSDVRIWSSVDQPSGSVAIQVEVDETAATVNIDEANISEGFTTGLVLGGSAAGTFNVRNNTLGSPLLITNATAKVNFANNIDLSGKGLGEAVQAMTLTNSWVNNGGGEPNAVYRREGNKVYIYGVIKDGTATDGTSIATLPVNYRPTSTAIILASHQSGGAEVPMRMRVNTDGTIAIYGCLNPFKVTFSGCFDAI